MIKPSSLLMFNAALFCKCLSEVTQPDREIFGPPDSLRPAQGHGSPADIPHRQDHTQRGFWSHFRWIFLPELRCFKILQSGNKLCFCRISHQTAHSSCHNFFRNHPPWRNWLARLTVIRFRLMAHQEVESSSLSGGDDRIFSWYSIHDITIPLVSSAAFLLTAV